MLLLKTRLQVLQARYIVALLQVLDPQLSVFFAMSVAQFLCSPGMLPVAGTLGFLLI